MGFLRFLVIYIVEPQLDIWGVRWTPKTTESNPAALLVTVTQLRVDKPSREAALRFTFIYLTAVVSQRNKTYLVSVWRTDVVIIVISMGSQAS